MVFIPIIVFFFMAIVDPGLATEVETGNKVEIEVGQENIVNQEQADQTKSSTGVSVSINSKSISPPGSFASGGQPTIPNGFVGHQGPGKEGWNIINTDIYKHLETLWSIKEAKKAVKGGGKIKSLYWRIPCPGSNFPRSKGVNVIFELNEETTLPPSAVPIGIVIVNGGEKTVLWHLVARAVLEASKKGATWLKIEKYDLATQQTSSASNIGLSGSGSKAGISAIAGLSGGSSYSRSGTESEPFLHAVAYGLAPSKSKKGE